MSTGSEKSREASRILSDDEEEDEELLEIVTETLQRRGILGKLKAEIRSNVYLAMENRDQALKRSRQCNSSLQDSISTSDGRLTLHLVREFLQFFNLKWTHSVFDVEALDTTPRSREELMENMGLSSETAHLSKNPLLFEILRLSKVSVLRSETPTYHTTAEDHSTTDSLTDGQEETDIEEGALTPSPTKLEFPASKVSQKPDLATRKELLPELTGGTVGSLSSLGDLPPLLMKKSLPSLSAQPELKGKKDIFLCKDSISEKDATPTPTPTSSVDVEEIEEELDEFLNSNLSEDFTKDESLSHQMSPKVDYIESL
uniref:FGFR1 oncogene partner n=1 Tax=Caligus clemensi TaxID=344056 RepID=C1C1K3_CALCM|nr:FGFR1 oncogene partner [Caligus clemensi]